MDVTSVNKLFMIPRMDLNGYHFFLRCEKLLTWLQLIKKKKKKIAISYKRISESLLYLESLQINTSLFEQNLGQHNPSQDMLVIPTRSRVSARFSAAEADRHLEGFLSFF